MFESNFYSVLLLLLLSSLVFARENLVSEFAKSHVRNVRSIIVEDDTSSVNKRDANSACVPPSNFVQKLTPGRTQHTFSNDNNPSISLTWSGTNGVMLALTTITNLFLAQSSRLYRSTDRGKTFSDISSQLSGGYIRKTSGMQVNPSDTAMVILFGYDTPYSTSHTTIYTTNNAGESFTKIMLPFKIDAASVKFNPFPQKKNRLLAKAVDEGALWLSDDFGTTWKLVQRFVQAVSWDPTNGDYFYFSYDSSHSLSKSSLVNELYRENALTELSVRLAQDVHSFAVQDNFLFLSVQFQGKNGSRVMHVSKNQGDSWDAAQLPLINNQQFYSLLDMSEDMVFIHVDLEGDTGFGTVYTSDERGIIYSKSLSKHLYPNREGLTDFYKVLSLPGVYITSQLSADQTIHSLITFDKGGTWQPITAPSGSHCAATEKSCQLQLHNYFSASKHVTLPALPLSSKNTVGLIMAHGNIGDGLNFNPPKVYVSVDGGYSWNQPAELAGPHYYGIGDAGGILYAVPYQTTPTNVIKFSLDEGQCWHSFNFSDTAIQVTGVSAEPGEKATDVTIWGWDRNGDGMWMAVTVDFHAIMGSQCQQTDLTKWTAHETNSVAQSSDGCLLGSKQSFIRRKAGTICTNAAIQAIATHKTCECEYTDYLCDYGYKRDESTLECVLDPAAATSNMDVCIEGTEEQIQTKGYRKIPGDKCTGGFVPHHAVKSLSKSCSKAEEIKDNTGVDKHAFVNYVPKSRSNPHTGWIVFLVILVLSLGGSLVYLVYKKRSVLMKVRYRPITQDEPHDDETPNGNLIGTETVIDDDDAVLVSMPNGDHLQSNGAVISYHDDSDEDLLVT